MFNLTNIPVHVNDVIFGEPSEHHRRRRPARQLRRRSLVGWYVAWTARARRVLWARYRKLTP